jgi:two-component system LytT family sensor kinase
MPSHGTAESSHEGGETEAFGGTFTGPRPPIAGQPLSPARRTALNALAIFGVWTTLGLLSFAQGALYFAQSGQHVSWGAFGARMLDWYTCAIFTPFFFWLAARFPVDRRRWRVNVFVQLGGSTVAVVIKYAFLFWFWQRTRPDRAMTFARVLEMNFIIESMIIWAVIAIIHGILFYRRWQEREQLAVELRSRLSEAQLDVLKGQLRPHFLFNTLNSISTLVHSDPASADRMVVQLADLLRASLETSGRHEIPLAEELALLERYVDIMRVRHEDRLTVTIRATPRARAALVPHFILQPLVENAIEHGIGRRAGSGRIVVDAEAVGQQLYLRLGDDGGGLTPGASGSLALDEGVGLGNTRHRLRQLYGEAHSFTIDRAENGGTLVTIAIPLRKPVTAEAPRAPVLAMTGDD